MAELVHAGQNFPLIDGGVFDAATVMAPNRKSQSVVLCAAVKAHKMQKNVLFLYSDATLVQHYFIGNIINISSICSI